MLLLNVFSILFIALSSVFSSSVKATSPDFTKKPENQLFGHSPHRLMPLQDENSFESQDSYDAVANQFKEGVLPEILGRGFIAPNIVADEEKKGDKQEVERPTNDIMPPKQHNGSPQIQANPIAITKESWTILAEENNTTFQIDKAYFDSQDRSQREKIEAEVARIQTYYKKEILSKIPKDILKSLNDYKIQFYFKKNIFPRGQFQKEIFVQDLGLGKKEQVVKVWIDAGLFFDTNLNRLMVHEFFHVVHFIQHPREQDWVQEGLAQVFEYMVLGKLNGLNFQAAFASSGTPIIGAYDPKKINRAQYGHNMLYFYYLYQHCGEEKLFWELSRPHTVKEEQILVGDAQINEALRLVDAAKIGAECKSFQQSAISYELARRHNKKIFSDDFKDVSLRYFLFPTGQQAAILEAKNLSEANKMLGEAPAYSPIRLSARLFADLQDKCKTCQQFYLQKSSPYKVIEGGTELARDLDKDDFDSVMVNLK